MHAPLPSLGGWVAAFEAAAARLPQVPRDYALAGEALRVHVGALGKARFVWDALAPLALTATAAAATPALEVFLWDGEGDRVELPGFPSTLPDGARSNPQGRSATSGLSAAFRPDTGFLWVFDSARARAYGWWRDAGVLPYYEHAAPLRDLWQRWLVARGGVLLHSAAVGTGEGGVLFVGPGGSGKSSTALACVEAGLGFTGDDYVLLGPGTTPQVYMAYSTAKVGRDRLPWHERYRGHFRNLARQHEKPMLFLHEVVPSQMLQRFPLRAIVLPVIARRSSTRIVPAAPAALLRALAPSSVLLVPSAGPAALQRIAQLCRDQPCFRAELSSDANEVGQCMKQWIATLSPLAAGVAA